LYGKTQEEDPREGGCARVMDENRAEIETGTERLERAGM
jgi:hypothetical protein